MKSVCSESAPQLRETNVFWECADPLIVGAGETEIALQASGFRHPGVPDSIELDNGDGVTRRASENPRFLVKHPGSMG